MRRKALWFGLGAGLCLTIVGFLGVSVLERTAWSQDVVGSDGVDRLHSIMRPDPETRARWVKEYRSLPSAYIDPEIATRLDAAEKSLLTTDYSLLSFLQYTPSQRNQTACGNCWLWASTGVSEIALNVQHGIKDRLSTQLYNSCGPTGGDFACCGGNLNDFVNWYKPSGGLGYLIPWSNTNASWQDGGTSCSNGTGVTVRACGDIATTPRYYVNSLSGTRIDTWDIDTLGIEVTHDTAIANIKNLLQQKKAVKFNYWMVTDADWNAFFDFWDYQSESTIWDPDLYCGHTELPDEAGGHAVMIIGYHDEAGTANDYWIVLNSWGSSALRPNGLFRMKMDMNYDCQNYWITNGWWDYDRTFESINVSFRDNKGRVVSSDFDGNGDDDKTVFRPSDGTWRRHGVGVAVAWGTNGDIPVSGFYNAGATADYAVWRPSNGTWYVKDIATVAYGTNGDIPVPGDYNGDTRTDYAVFRPSNSTWYIKTNGTGATTSYTFGAFGDVPTPGDWDGDGKTEAAVFRPRNGTWYKRTDIGSTSSHAFGTAGDIPVAGNYNADGTTDYGLFRPSAARWYLEYSSGGTTQFSFGSPGDIPIVADLSGSATQEFAVFRPSNGRMYVKGVAGSYALGASNDIPASVIGP